MMVLFRNVQRRVRKKPFLSRKLFTIDSSEAGGKSPFPPASELGLSIDQMSQIEQHHQRSYRLVKKLNQEITGSKKIRQANFPEAFSENLVRQIISRRILREPKTQVDWHTKTGDLIIRLGPDLAKSFPVEVKCFSSFCSRTKRPTPSTFSSSHQWEELYFLDATRFLDSYYRCWQIRVSATNPIWLNLRVSQTETIQDQYRQKRRVKISFSEIQQQLPTDQIQLIFDDYWKNVFRK